MTFFIFLKFDKNCIISLGLTLRTVSYRHLPTVLLSTRHQLLAFSPQKFTDDNWTTLSACKTFLFDMKRQKKFPMKKSNNLIDFITKAFVDVREWHMRLQGWYQSSLGNTRRRKVASSDSRKKYLFLVISEIASMAEFRARIIFYFEASMLFLLHSHNLK